MTLGDRLRQVVTGAVPRVAPDRALPDQSHRGAPFDSAVHRVALDRIVPPSIDSIPRRACRINGPHAADILAGQWVESSEGAVIIVDRYYTAERSHGRQRIGAVVEMLEAGRDGFDVLARAWPRRDAGRDYAAPSDWVNGDSVNGGVEESPAVPAVAYGPKLCFLDLETTGLAGGAGTQAFLVGCAIVEDGGFRIRQFLLPGFEHERALLGSVAEWTTSQGTLVTFNGRTFDVPLIETRYLLHRMSFPLVAMPHLDMLHPARRLWKQRPSIVGPPLDEDSCKLTVLERHLAGYHRVGDVPPFEIPSRYFRFVRDGDAHPLEAVLEHNRIDLMSLALITARALMLIQQGPASASHPRECLGLGRVYERAGVSENAEACFLRAASLAARVGREPDVHAEALRRLALCRRRTGRMTEAAAAWRDLIAVPGCPSTLRREAREALAIHHEHRSRDLQTARTFVLDVLAESASPRWRDRAEYRLRRIERKLSRRTNIPLPIEPT